MAEIYLARSIGIESFEKYVVVKRILPRLVTDERYVGMFLDEARLAATLHHQNIAHVYDIGRTGDEFFFAMEYLHGPDVRTILNRLLGVGTGLPLAHVLTILSGVCAGLHYAHELKTLTGESLGVVHRDISPSNIVVTYEGAVKLVDFGVARVDDEDRRQKTEAGKLKGKIPYMSPEQCVGEVVDRRSDIFSLGIVLYEMSTLSRLFKSTGRSQFKVMESIVNDPIPPPSNRVSDYPAELERIVMKCLEKKPEDRYQSARQLQIDIENFATKAGMPLSMPRLADFIETKLGRPKEPWQDLESAGTLPPAKLEGTVSYVEIEPEVTPPASPPPVPPSSPSADVVALPLPAPRPTVPLHREAAAVLAGLGEASAAGDNRPTVPLRRPLSTPPEMQATTAQPLAPRRSVVVLGAVAAVLLGVVGALVAHGSEGPSPKAITVPLDGTAVEPRDSRTQLFALESPRKKPKMVSIRFEGSPKDPELLVGGVPLEGSVLRVPRNEAIVVVVKKKRFKTTTLRLTAESDRTVSYELKMSSRAPRSSKPSCPPGWITCD